MKITDTITYVGVNDRKLDLFEGQYIVPEGMAYNSYLIEDEKIAVIDSVEAGFAQEWIDRIKAVIGEKTPDYLIVQHMEPDHSSGMAAFMEAYPETILVGNAMTFRIMDRFFKNVSSERLVVKAGDTLNLGSHTLNFIFAPMVHWPEVMNTYESSEKVLFSADAFGKFGVLDADEDWACEARRYYFGIVGKYGAQVQQLLNAAASLEIEAICPLHGPVLTENLSYYIDKYKVWSAYEPEDKGVTICYTSVYGNTKQAVEILAALLKVRGVEVSVFDLARDDMAEAVEDAFRYDRLVLATTTYNTGIFPFMHDFIHHLEDHAYQNRTVGFIENGSWFPMALKKMQELTSVWQNMKYIKNNVTVNSAIDDESRAALVKMADELAAL